MREIPRFITDRVRKLNVWKRGGERAPHKPLLLLLALARITQGCERLATFGELQKPLTRLLRRYGPSRKSVHPEYPFWRLQTDDLWEVTNSDGLIRRVGSSDPKKSELLRTTVYGGFPMLQWEEFKEHRSLLERIAARLLHGHFPESLHGDILNDVGLSMSSTVFRRSSDFQCSVLTAYGHQCAICGYDAKIGTSDIGLEAAHIKWHQAGGPDDVNNGVALCSIHHKALDCGAIGISENLKVLLSCEVHGSTTQNWFERFQGTKLHRPGLTAWEPQREYIRWHFEEVFKRPARD
jgi:putative restriction endonuclease